MKPNVLDSAVVAVLRCCTDLQVRRSGARSEGIRPPSVSGRTGCSKKWNKRYEQRGHQAASTMASCTHIAMVRAISHPWWRTAPWSTESRGAYAHVFMVGTALAGPDARVSCRRCSSEHNGSTCAVRLLVVDELAAA